MKLLADAFLDSAKLLPLLFLIYFAVEYLEHENNNFMHHLFSKSKRLGPLLGAIFGTIPQCGFSVIASELYAKRAVTIGTLIAIFLATSDEAIPLMLAHPDKMPQLFALLGIKFLIAVVFGFLIDFAVKSNVADMPCADDHANHSHFHGNCESCHSGSVVLTACKHAVKIFVFIFIVNLIFGLTAEHIAPFMQFITNHKILQTLIASLFGIIPNCAASVVLTELYLGGKITLASLIGGLCTGAGVGLVVLFKQNKNLKQNIAVIALLYIIGAGVGIMLQFIL